jgi:hypothetical protein
MSFALYLRHHSTKVNINLNCVAWCHTSPHHAKLIVQCVNNIDPNGHKLLGMPDTMYVKQVLCDAQGKIYYFMLL